MAGCMDADQRHFNLARYDLAYFLEMSCDTSPQTPGVYYASGDAGTPRSFPELYDSYVDFIANCRRSFYGPPYVPLFTYRQWTDDLLLATLERANLTIRFRRLRQDR
jgi:hypothetical protein